MNKFDASLGQLTGLGAVAFFFCHSIAFAETNSAIDATAEEMTSRPNTATNEQAVSSNWVISTLLKNNASVRAAALTARQGREVIRSEEGRFPYTFEADAGVTRSRTPALGAQGAVVAESNSTVIGTQLSRTFPSGTSATIRAEGQRYERTGTATQSTIVSSQSGTGYQATIRATVTQPLLSGYGSTVNEAGLRAARIDERRLQIGQRTATSELVRDALSAYWELWYCSRAAEIQAGALRLAISQHREAEAKVAQGAASLADSLKFRTQVASLNEAWLTAMSAERQQSIELSRLIGLGDASEVLRASATEPDIAYVLSAADAKNKVFQESPELTELRETVHLAEEKRRSAGDEYRARLDVSTWVEAAGLGVGQVSPVTQQIGSLNAVSVYGGLTYQSTLDTKRLEAARAKADYDIHIARAKLEATERQLAATTQQLLVKIELASVSYDAAQQTLAIASKQAENERHRYSLGAATPLDVQVADDAQRQAELRVLRARVDRVKSGIALKHYTGDLIKTLPGRLE